MTEAQQAFDFTRTHSRRGDPATSKSAAQDAAKFAASQAGRVLQALKAIEPAGKTRIAAACGLTDIQTARRLADLQHAGLAAPVDSVAGFRRLGRRAATTTELSTARKPERLWVAV